MEQQKPKKNRSFRERHQQSVSPARWIAYRVLRDWAENKGFVEDLLTNRWNRSRDLKPEDLRLSQELVYGVFRRRRLLDFWIDRLAAKGIGSLPEEIVDVLRIGVYQVAFLDRVPDHAAFYETVEMTRAAGFGGLTGVVNAVLRNFPRRRDSFSSELERMENRLGIETSHPDWLMDWAVQRWGKEKASVWLAWNSRIPPIFLYLFKSASAGDDTPGLSSKTLEGELQSGELESGGEYQVLPAGSFPGEYPLVREGRAIVQDPSAGKAVHLLDPKPGERIYDLCSAPGGKTLQIADLTDDQSEIWSVDSNEKRLAKVSENLERCSKRSVKTVCWDLLTPPPPDWPMADAVLVDVPCSGLGTLRRRVDLRYRIQPEDVTELAEKAGTILDNASRLVGRGGRLVYSTCTLTSEENEGVVEEFLRKAAGSWKPVGGGITPPWLESGDRGIPDPLPECDGAYSVLLVKTK